MTGRPAPRVAYERVHDRAARVTERGMDDRPRRFVDREQRLVFIKDVEGRVLSGHRAPLNGVGKRDSDDISERGARRCSADYRAVYRDAPGLDPCLNASPRGA